MRIIARPPWRALIRRALARISITVTRGLSSRNSGTVSRRLIALPILVQSLSASRPVRSFCDSTSASLESTRWVSSAWPISSENTSTGLCVVLATCVAMPRPRAVLCTNRSAATKLCSSGTGEVDHPIELPAGDRSDAIPGDGGRCPPPQPIVVEKLRQDRHRLAARTATVGMPVVGARLAGGGADRGPRPFTLGLDHVVPHLHRQGVDRVLALGRGGGLGGHALDCGILAEDADLAAERCHGCPVHDLHLEGATPGAVVGDPSSAPLRTHTEAQQEVHHVE